MESCIVQWDKGFKLKLLKLLHAEMWLLLKLSQCTSLFVHCTVLYSMPYMYHILYTLYVNSILHNLHYRYTLYILHLMLFNMANLGEVVLMAQKMHNNYPHHTSSVSRSVRYTVQSRSVRYTVFSRSVRYTVFSRSFSQV